MKENPPTPFLRNAGISNKLALASKIRPTVTAFVLVLTFASSAAFSQEDNRAEDINAANQLVRDGKFTEAIDAYSEIEPSEEQRDEFNYNLAIAHYRNGDLESASTLFSEAMGSTNTTIAANSRYNQGNCSYSMALEKAEQDKPAAIEHLKEAITHYRNSLRTDSDNADARANIELAVKLLNQLEDEQEQDQQEQDQQEQDQQEQDQQQQDQQEQDQQEQDQQEQDQQQQDQQQQDQQQQDQQQQDQQQQDQQQQDQQQQDQQQQDQQQQDQQQQDQQQQDQQQQDQQQSDSNDQSKERQTQNRDRQDPENSDEPDSAEDSDDKDEEKQTDEKSSAGKLTSKSEPKESDLKQSKEAAALPDDKDGMMTREEALKLLQAVRDREMLRQLQQQRQQRKRRVPVDRDW